MSNRLYATALEGYGDVMATMQEITEAYKELKKAVNDMHTPIRTMDERHLSSVLSTICGATSVLSVRANRMAGITGAVESAVQRQTGGGLLQHAEDDDE